MKEGGGSGGARMELFQAKDHYILQSGERALWCSRRDGSLQLRAGGCGAEQRARRGRAAAGSRRSGAVREDGSGGRGGVAEGSAGNGGGALRGGGGGVGPGCCPRCAAVGAR